MAGSSGRVMICWSQALTPMLSRRSATRLIAESWNDPGTSERLAWRSLSTHDRCSMIGRRSRSITEAAMGTTRLIMSLIILSVSSIALDARSFGEDAGAAPPGGGAAQAGQSSAPQDGGDPQVHIGRTGEGPTNGPGTGLPGSESRGQAVPGSGTSGSTLNIPNIANGGIPHPSVPNPGQTPTGTGSSPPTSTLGTPSTGGSR